VNKNKYIQTVEASQLRDDIPSFSPGDTVVVDVRVVEGSRVLFCLSKRED
jgi:large subunit ribosomal protein L19